ncbi:alpha-galactosidase [Bacteroidia bacterium]|nr:alpha-galactosidase [Bacteroidia bacterium]
MTRATKFLAAMLLALPAIVCAQKNSTPVIAIETDATGLYLVVDELCLKQSHYGARVADPGQFLQVRDMARDAYPVYGSGNPNELALAITHGNGNVTTMLAYKSHRSWDDPSDGNIKWTEITLEDTAYPVTVLLTYKAFACENVIQTMASVVSRQQRITINSIASCYLNLKSSAYYLSRLYGAPGFESNLLSERMSEGIKVFDSKRGVRNSHYDNQSFMIALENPAGELTGEVVGGALCWTGNFRMSYQVDVMHNCYVWAGINPYQAGYVLLEGGRFDTPWMALTYSPSGKGEITRNFHDWGRKYMLNEPQRIRPVALNSWEGVGMDFDQKTILEMIDRAADLGAEVFVLDDGWFGNKYPRNDERNGLGDWDINKKKLPDGFTKFIERARARGIMFGIWIEPEMVNPSQLAEKHPDWIVKAPDRPPLMHLSRQRSQQILDLSNPRVQDFVFDVFDGILKQNPEIGYVKWDANRYAPDHGSQYLPPDMQGNLWIDYVKGLYSVYERIVKKYPHTIIQLCSSGGGRVDWGAMGYHHEFWPSDNTDALQRVYTQWGINHFFPAMATSAHISQVPNHTTSGVTPLKFRIDVAMSGRLGVELQPRDMTPEELKTISSAIAQYKTIREVIQLGDLYRLTSPYEDNFASMVYVSKDRSQAVAFCFVTKYSPAQDYPVIRFSGLDPNRTYAISEINPGKSNGSPSVGKSFTGDFLMKNGIRTTFWRACESAVFRLNAK